MYGDITDINVIEQTIKNVKNKFPNGLDIITADGGFDITNYNTQEILTSKLFICEIYTAINTQKIGGMFIIKFFDMFCHNTIVYYLLLCSMYEFVKIIKPYTSRNSNSERYLVCYSFKGLVNQATSLVNQATSLVDSIRNIIINFKNNKVPDFTIFPNLIIPNQLINKIITFNNLILYEQIKTINESIKMIQNKDFYFQNLILKIFLENKISSEKIKLVSEYKHILGTRINKSIKFLRNFNINMYKIN